MSLTISLADAKMALTEKIAALQSQKIEDSANFKFMNLLRSRLIEEGIPLDVSSQIVANLDYDMSMVNEEDDYLGDVALAYAEFAARVYTKLHAGNWHRNMTDALIRQYFCPMKISL